MSIVIYCLLLFNVFFKDTISASIMSTSRTHAQLLFNSFSKMQSLASYPSYKIIVFMRYTKLQNKMITCIF